MSDLLAAHRSLPVGVTIAYAASVSATVVLGGLLQRARVNGGPAAVALIAGAVMVAGAAWVWPSASLEVGSAVPLVVGAALPAVSAYLALVTLERRSLPARGRRGRSC
jgi:hypothetical protein